MKSSNKKIIQALPIETKDKNIEGKIKEILAEKLKIDIEKIKPECNLVEDLGMDSFGSIEIIFEVENIFKIKVPNSALPEIKVVSDLLDYVKSQIDKTNKKNAL